MGNEIFKPVSDEELRKTIAIKIRSYRKSISFTQKQLSEISGVSVASIQRIEQEHDLIIPGVPTLLRLTNAMGRDLADVFS